MTLTAYLPRISLFDRAARKPKHRASDEVARLQHQLNGAELLMAGYRIQLDDLHREHAATVKRIDERYGEIVRGLEKQIADLERRLNVGVLAEAAAAQTQEIPVITRVLPMYESPLTAVDPAQLADLKARGGHLGPATNPGQVNTR